jgi:hypothetical protein
MRIAHKGLVGKPEGKRLDVSWKEQFMMLIEEVRWGLDFIQLAVGTVR